MAKGVVQGDNAAVALLCEAGSARMAVGLWSCVWAKPLGDNGTPPVTEVATVGKVPVIACLAEGAAFIQGLLVVGGARQRRRAGLVVDGACAAGLLVADARPGVRDVPGYLLGCGFGCF